MPGPFPSCLLACLAASALLLPLASQAQPAVEASPAPSFDLEIRGPAAARELLERHLELRRYREVPDLDDAELARLVTLAQHDARELLGTLGYFSPTVKVTREAGARPTLVVEVELGEKTVVKDVEITFDGAIATAPDPSTVAQREGIRSGWGLPAGQGFTQAAWDDAKAQALRRLAAKRFLAGRIGDSLAEVDAAAHQASLGLRLESGPMYRLGALEVKGVAGGGPRHRQRRGRIGAAAAGRANSGGIAGRFGLDELSVRRDDAEGAVVTLGNRVARDFYASYESSLGGALGTLNIFYDISRRLTMRARAGERTYVDLIYTFSFN